MRTNTHGLDVTRASKIVERPHRWLWPELFPADKVSIIAGEAGIGKSQVGINIAARVSTGACWPDRDDRARRGDVVLVSAEDNAADTIMPRLNAAGANLGRIHLVESVSDCQRRRRRFSLVTDLDGLDHALHKLKNPRAVIIDPLNACLESNGFPRFNASNVEDVRRLLGRLEGLASKHRVAIIAITHFTKAHNGSALARISGSFAFTAAVRSTFTVTRCWKFNPPCTGSS